MAGVHVHIPLYVKQNYQENKISKGLTSNKPALLEAGVNTASIVYLPLAANTVRAESGIAGSEKRLSECASLFYASGFYINLQRM